MATPCGIIIVGSCYELLRRKNSLVLEVLHQALHVPQLCLQLDLLVAQAIQLSAQVGDVGLEHGVDVGAGGCLLLQQLPLGLQHLVLLLQEAHLHRNTHTHTEIV